MPNPALPASALSAFLRGIERRALVFALAQAGDETASRAAVLATVRDFSAEAGDTAIGNWPARFWTLLVQRPELARGIGGDPVLAALSPGPRAALLLRLVAGLDFAHGAQVLAVSEPTYRFALQRGLDQLHAAGHDMAVLEALRESLRLRVAASASGIASEPVAPAIATARPAGPEPALPRRRGAAVLAAGLASLLLAAVALSLLPPVDAWLQAQFSPAATPSVSTPPLSLDEVGALVTHPDFDLLRAPADEALAQDLGFLAWYEAGAPLPGDTAGGDAFTATDDTLPVAADFSALPAAERDILMPIAGLWPQLDAGARRRLRDNAVLWRTLDGDQRENLRQRAGHWDAQPAGVRAQRRAAHSRWLWLSTAERTAVRTAARRFVALPPAQQQELRQRHAGLPEDTQIAWSLGPMMGRALPPLAPLFEFVPADERDALLAVVRTLTPAKRGTLASRIATMPPAERGRLRRQLIATPPEKRGTVLGEPAPK